jgi:uncharacterized protein YggE
MSNSQPWKVLPLVLLICATFASPVLAQEKEKLLRTLSVSGHGVQTIPTTLSQVDLGVEVQGKTAQAVQQESARRSSAVVDLLRSRNVDKLHTTGINVEPAYSYQNNEQRIIGYTANNSVSFRVPTEKAGAILDAAVKAGATRINDVSFVASDEAIASAQKQALQKATQDAQQQADAVLSTLGLKPKEVLSIQIDGANAPPPPRVIPVAAMLRSASAEAQTPVVGGEQQVEATVTLQISY